MGEREVLVAYLQCSGDELWVQGRVDDCCDPDPVRVVRAQPRANHAAYVVALPAGCLREHRGQLDRQQSGGE